MCTGLLGDLRGIIWGSQHSVLYQTAAICAICKTSDAHGMSSCYIELNPYSLFTPKSVRPLAATGHLLFDTLHLDQSLMTQCDTSTAEDMK